ncbi:MAG: DNA repair protein RecO [Candidatus Omnitrophica bacterium]|nr:DNA repair protein RecO [Candidatus Omnitrophota bacterium]
MAIHKTDAIVLRKQDIRETSLAVVFYTRDFGKIRGLIKGARGPRGYLGYQVQLFTLNKVVFYDSRKSGVHTISYCDLSNFFEHIRTDIVKTGYACYFVELVDALTAEKDKNEDIFELLINSLRLLESGASPKRISRMLEIKLLKFSGIMPRLESCAVCGDKISVKDASFGRSRFSCRLGGLTCEQCSKERGISRKIMPGTANFIEHVERAPYEKLSRIKASRDVGEELEEVMKEVLEYQLDTKIKSLEFLEKIEK